MILEYKREQQKFEVMEEEICNQQKEIENLRQLILSTNFMNQNPTGSACSSAGTIGSATNSFSSPFGSSAKRPSLGKETATKQLAKDLGDKVSGGQKAKVCQEKRSVQVASQQVQPNLREVNRSAGEFKQFARNKSGDQRATPNREPDAGKPLESNPHDRRLLSNKPKGLQTINKNVLNQKDNKYSNDKFDKSGEPKKDDLIKRKAEDLIEPNDDSSPTIRKSDELLSRITKLKSISNHKFENQENPIKECLGINRSSKGINKKARQVKSALKATKSSSSINRILS